MLGDTGSGIYHYEYDGGGNVQRPGGAAVTREVNYTSSSRLSNPAAERTPLLDDSSGEGVLHSESSKSHSVEGYRFDLSKEKRRFRKLFYDRVPKGKAAFVVFLVNVLESFAFYGSLNLIRYALFDHHSVDQRESDFLFTVLFYTAGRVFYPLAGLVADVYLGRYHVIHIGLWLFWVGFAVMLVSLAVGWHYEKYPAVLRAFLIIATVLFMLGSACVESPIIPFGVDQIRQGAPSDELSSYFFWYLFGRNAGVILEIACTIVAQASFKAYDKEIGIINIRNTTVIRNVEETIIFSSVGGIALIGVTVALLLHFCLRHWFFEARCRDNPVRSICNVLYFAATVKRHAPLYRRAFRYSEGRKPRIELAKVEFDGIYSAEEVEDVKTFLRIFLLVLSLSSAFTTYGALSSIYGYNTTTKHNIKHGGTYLFTLVDCGVVLLFVPFLNHIVLPCVRGATMRRRIGVGSFFLLLSAAVGTITEWKIKAFHTEHERLLWVLAPIVLFALGETLFFVSGIEFIYAQSPDSMKGFLTGIFYFVFGSFSAVGTTLFRYEMHNMWFYYIILIICGLGFLLYLLVAYCYKNRQRPTNDESEQDILHRSFATSVYLS